MPVPRVWFGVCAEVGFVQGIRAVSGREGSHIFQLKIKVTMWTNSTHLLSNMRKKPL